MSNDKFKNSPIHDKKSIIDMMDELEPKDMVEVVELLKSKQPKQSKQQTAVEKFLNAIKDQIPLSKEHLEMVESYANQAKEMEKEQIKKAVNFGDERGNVVSYSTAEQYYNETYGGKQ